ncbi:Hypothetical predicted protein [Marmota monax]|uniref:non-specific serine/threonine protein kinase n=1 Tax=Marmota monax TaxID=9995 RepID=A0A5E4A6Z6_MARMO|nr:hypothetical protein GHT09_014965 [Marmota monax]VTJ52472.1 Hypothetical predicted protein [Marmota monax]
MAALDHGNMIQLLQVISTKKYIYLIIEHAGGGQLWDLIPETNGMCEEESRRLFRQVARAMKEALPKLLDPTIMNIMIHMGYHPFNTWVSVESCKFDVMVTYGTLEHQRTQGEACALQMKPKHDPGPMMSPRSAPRSIPMSLPCSCPVSGSSLRRPSSPSRRLLQVPEYLPSLSTSSMRTYLLPALPCAQLLILPRYLDSTNPRHQRGLEEAEEEDHQMHPSATGLPWAILQKLSGSSADAPSPD